MAQINSQILLMKAGITYGTTPTFTAADALKVFDLDCKELVADMAPRNFADGEAGQTGGSAFTRPRSELVFSFEAAGSGTAGTKPAWLPVIEACGFLTTTVVGVSNTISPASLNSTLAFADFKCKHAGADYFSYGARGSWELSMTSGEVPRVTCNSQGIYTAPVQAAMSAPTYSNQALGVVVDASNTPTVEIGSLETPIARCISAFTLNAGSTATYFNEAGCTSPEIRITDRQPTATIAYRETTFTDFNVHEAIQNRTPHALRIIHGPVGARSTIILPKVRFNTAEKTDRDGVLYRTCELEIDRTAGTNDWMTWKLD